MLSICIPTYNRKKCVCALVNSIIESGLLSKIDLIVIDDGSSDNTYAELQKLKYPSDVNARIIYQKNKGLANTLLSFFLECETEYLMVVADDDVILAEGIRGLINFLNEKNPDFVSPRWLASNGVCTDRGRTIAEKIDLKNLHQAADHAPGLVYRREAMQCVLEPVIERIKKGCYISTIYPQVVLLLYLSLQTDKFWWYPEAVGGYAKSGPEPSQLRDKNGNEWSSVVGRWQQQISFAGLYSYLISTTSIDSKKSDYTRLLVLHKTSVYRRIRGALAAEAPELLTLFDGGSVLYNIRNFYSNIKSFYLYVKTRFSKKLR
jgi:glycosyltransferase involved in cell wall biosynthesis